MVHGCSYLKLNYEYFFAMKGVGDAHGTKALDIKWAEALDMERWCNNSNDTPKNSDVIQFGSL